MLALLASSDATDTWGIPGPLFAVLYPVIGVALVLLVRRFCRRLGDRPARDDDRLTDVEELACLSHRGLPIETALAQLVSDRVLTDGASNSVTSQAVPLDDAGRRPWWKGRSLPEPGREPEPVPDAVSQGVHVLPLLPGEATPLTRAVHAALLRASVSDGTLTTGALTRDALARDAEVSSEVARLELTLRGRGLILGDGVHALRRALLLAAFAVVLGVGAARFSRGLDDGKPVMVLAVEMIGFVVWLWIGWSSHLDVGPVRLTTRGRHLLQEAVEEYEGALWFGPYVGDRPVAAPRAFDQRRLPLSVALFGTPALALLHPEIADVLDLPTLIMSTHDVGALELTGFGGGGSVGSGAGGGGCGGGGGACGG